MYEGPSCTPDSILKRDWKDVKKVFFTGCNQVKPDDYAVRWKWLNKEGPKYFFGYNDSGAPENKNNIMKITNKWYSLFKAGWQNEKPTGDWRNECTAWLIPHYKAKLTMASAYDKSRVRDKDHDLYYEFTEGITKISIRKFKIESDTICPDIEYQKSLNSGDYNNKAVPIYKSSNLSYRKRIVRNSEPIKSKLISTFDLKWENGDVGFNIFSPSGKEIEPDYVDTSDNSYPNKLVSYSQSENGKQFVIENAEIGNWNVEIIGENIEPEGTIYTLSVEHINILEFEPTIIEIDTLLTVDTDGDGMPDVWEADYGFDLLVNDSLQDPDGDGISNLDEYKNGTDPNVADTPPVPTFTVPGEYATIQEAIDAAYAAGGGVVLVSKGTYYENLTLKDKVWLKAEGDPANTIIDGGEKGNVIVLNGETTPSGIIGFTIQGSQKNGNAFGGIVINGNNDPVIANCTIKDNKHGIVINGNGNPRIVNNVITENTGNGIEANGNPPATIENNIIVNNQGEGISCNGQPSMTIAYNNIWNNGSAKNNARSKPKEDKDKLDKPDNDKPDNGKADCSEGENNISADPLFVSPENGNYRLASGSPCIDSGNPAIQDDEDSTRSDMGAYGGKAITPATDDNGGNNGGSDNETWLSATLDGEADLEVYDPDGKSVKKAEFEGNGKSPHIDLTELKNGKYRFVLRCRKDGTARLTIKGYSGKPGDAANSTEFLSQTQDIETEKGRLFKADVSVAPDDMEISASAFVQPANKHDIDCDGKTDQDDLDVVIVNVMDCITKNKCNDFFDRDGDGKIGFSDITEVANSITSPTMALK